METSSICQHVDMTERELITTLELAELRGVTRQAITASVRRGTLEPAIRLANGHLLFERPVIESSAA